MIPSSWYRPAAAALAALLASTAPARVHPHVFAEARLQVEINPDGTVKTLHHLWRFDELFSSTVLMDFDKNGDFALDDAELEEVAKTIHDSIGEYKFFQIVTADGKDVAMRPPEKLMVDYQDSQLIVLFDSAPEKPLKLSGKIDFGIYDPTFYTAIDFTSDDMMEVTGLPANCTRKVVRPNPDEAIAENRATLTDAFFNDPTGTNMSKIFATKLELDCAKG